MTALARAVLVAAAAAAVLAACGGGDNPLGNPPTVTNSGASNGQVLSFVYFQKCINPVLVGALTLPDGATGSCASSGCHDDVRGTGGALRLAADAQQVDIANTADAIRATAMYRNFYSSQGSSVIGAPDLSRLIDKPLLQGVLHGGGLIFANADAPEVKRLRYWVGRPLPAGQDEFSSAAASMFTPNDPATGACNVQ